MAQHDSAVSKLACRLTKVAARLASSIGDTHGAALQEIIEADLTAPDWCGTWSRPPTPLERLAFSTEVASRPATT